MRLCLELGACPPCAVKPCAVRPVFARVVRELRTTDPSKCPRAHEAKCLDGVLSARLRGRTATQRSKQGSEKVLGRVLGKWFSEGFREGGLLLWVLQ